MQADRFPAIGTCLTHRQDRRLSLSGERPLDQTIHTTTQPGSCRQGYSHHGVGARRRRSSPPAAAGESGQAHRPGQWLRHGCPGNDCSAGSRTASRR